MTPLLQKLNFKNQPILFIINRPVSFIKDEELIKGDALVWFAYPRLSSKILKSDINRDKNWDILGANDFEAVRQVAVGENWSAIRFRKVDYIKK